MGSDSVSKAKTAEVVEEGGGSSFYWKVAHGVNLHKFLLGPSIYALMVWYDCFTPAAWTYLVLHASYGLLWLAKDLVFPDKGFHARVGLVEPVMAFTFCNVTYLAIPWILVTHARSITPWYQCAAIALFLAGMFMMNGSDCQKYFAIKLAPGTLITNGFFKYVRHPNYLGETMIYAALSMLTGTAWGFLPTLISTTTVFLPNMSKIDRSLSRYPEFAAWKASTYHMLPLLY